MQRRIKHLDTQNLGLDRSNHQINVLCAVIEGEMRGIGSSKSGTNLCNGRNVQRGQILRAAVDAEEEWKGDTP